MVGFPIAHVITRISPHHPTASTMSLHQAIEDDDTEELRRLLSQPGMDVDQRDTSEPHATPLMVAAYYNR